MCHLKVDELVNCTFKCCIEASTVSNSRRKLFDFCFNCIIVSSFEESLLLSSHESNNTSVMCTVAFAS